MSRRRLEERLLSGETGRGTWVASPFGMTTGQSWLAAVFLPLALWAAACGGGAGHGPGGTGGAAGGKAGSNGSGGAAGGNEAGRGGTAGLGSAGAAGTGGMAGGGRGGGTTAAGGATSSVCDLATDGGTCTAEGVICGGPCPDVCQFCHLIRCSSGHWMTMEAYPAPCFACGDGKCPTERQYCKTTIGGVPGAVPSYLCKDLPAECLTNRTCVCLAQQHVTGSCSMGANGELMTLLAAP